MAFKLFNSNHHQSYNKTPADIFKILLSRLGRRFCKNQGVVLEDDGRFYCKGLKSLHPPNTQYRSMFNHTYDETRDQQNQTLEN